MRHKKQFDNYNDVKIHVYEPLFQYMGIVSLLNVYRLCKRLSSTGVVDGRLEVTEIRGSRHLTRGANHLSYPFSFGFVQIKLWKHYTISVHRSS